MSYGHLIDSSLNSSVLLKLKRESLVFPVRPRQQFFFEGSATGHIRAMVDTTGSYKLKTDADGVSRWTRAPGRIDNPAPMSPFVHAQAEEYMRKNASDLQQAVLTQQHYSYSGDAYCPSILYAIIAGDYDRSATSAMNVQLMKDNGVPDYGEKGVAPVLYEGVSENGVIPASLLEVVYVDSVGDPVECICWDPMASRPEYIQWTPFVVHGTGSNYHTHVRSINGEPLHYRSMTTNTGGYNRETLIRHECEMFDAYQELPDKYVSGYPAAKGVVAICHDDPNSTLSISPWDPTNHHVFNHDGMISSCL